MHPFLSAVLASLAVGALLEVDNYGFPQLLENERVLVTFHAPWCSKCGKFLPELRKAEKVLSNETPPMKFALVGTCSIFKFLNK